MCFDKYDKQIVINQKKIFDWEELMVETHSILTQLFKFEPKLGVGVVEDVFAGMFNEDLMDPRSL